MAHSLRLALVASLLLIVPRVAAERPGAPGAGTRAPSPAQLAAADALQRATPGVVVRWDAVSGSPRWIVAPPGGALARTGKRTAEDAGRSFLRGQAALFGLGPRDLDALERTSTVPAQGGGTHVYFTQRAAGLEVEGGRVNLTVTEHGDVLWVGARLFGGLAADVTPRVDARQALVIAVSDVYPGMTASGSIRSSHDGPERRTAFDDPQFARPPEARLELLPHGSATRLVWEVRVAERGLATDYRVLVDAEDGRVLQRQDRTAHATARVLTGTKPDPEADEWSPSNHALLAIPGTTPESPLGWLGGDGTSLAGNNASSHLVEDTLPSLSDPTAAYDYPFNTKESALVNAWYWVNYAHDRFYALGFDEAAGNFQADNLGLGGVGGDAVRVVQRVENYWYWDGVYDVPASFNAGADGVPPVLSLGWVHGCRNCADHDGIPTNGGDRLAGYMRDALLHEYAHGVIERRVGGPATDPCFLGGRQTIHMREGWSDLLAATFVVEPRFGEYVREGPGWMRDVRQDVSYGEYCTVAYGGNCSSYYAATEGLVWGGVLWTLRQSMAALDPIGGIEDFDRLIVESLAVTACQPSMLDGRDAMLATDTLLFGSAHNAAIWHAFASRGMGEQASTTGPDDRLPIEDFTVPAAHACAAPGAPTGLAAGNDAANAVRLTYTSTGASAIEIWRDDLGNPADSAVAIGSTTDSATFVDLGVQGGKSYRYHVVALGSAGLGCASAHSATADVTATGACAAAFPILVPNLRVIDDGNPSCQVTLQWDPALPGCPGSPAPVVYNVYRSLESRMEESAFPPSQQSAGSAGFDPSERLLVGRTTGTSFVDVPVGKDVGVGDVSEDSAVHYLVLAQHGTLADLPDHRDRGSSQVLQWTPATPTLGRTTVQLWDFDSGPDGWTTYFEPGLFNPTEPPDSRWELVDPSPTFWGGTLLAPDEAASGTGLAWVTGDAEGAPSNVASHNAEGNQHLVSPTWDGTAGATILSFDYWAHGTEATSGDGLAFRVDNGTTGRRVTDSQAMTTQRFRGPGRYGWQRAEIDLARVVTPTSTMSLSFECSSCGIFSEFGIDNVRIERATSCARSKLKLATVQVDDSPTGWGDGDGRLEPGEIARLTVFVRNDGAATAATPSGFASTREAGAAVLDAHAAFPDIAPGATASNLGDGFVIRAPAAADCFGSTVLDLLFTDATGEQARGIWAAVADNDADGVCAAVDNCATTKNSDQADTDVDGVGNACDNCPDASNPSQANGDGDTLGDACDYCPEAPGGARDRDGDGFGDQCDCRPSNPAIHGPPGRVAGVRYPTDSKTRLAWDPEPQAEAYEVHEGFLSAGAPFEYVHVCEEGLVTTVPEVDDPVYFAGPGDLVYYLVVAENGCGTGDLGTDSAGVPRPFTPCP